MTNVQSKFLTPVLCTCQEFQHPWTKHCANASAGLLLASIPYCLRVYTMVYMISLMMRHRIPKRDDLIKTIRGILQSTAFLCTNAFSFILYNCFIRYLLGGYYWLTVSFVPAFFASFTALLVERPERRSLLTLYVANVATETIWNMAESRGLVRSIPHGQTLIFGVSISILLYLYRLGLHKTSCKDSIFNILRIFVGKPEEGPRTIAEAKPETSTTQSRTPLNLTTINGIVQAYGRFIDTLKSKHKSCPHKESCISYAAFGGLKPFIGGISLQVALKLIMNIKKIVQNRMNWRKSIFNRETLKLGIFLGSFSLLYKSVSCLLRRTFGKDDPLFAIPAGLIGSIAFTQYPDVTVALYVMWKTLQIVYNYGIEKKVLPKVPGFKILLYSFCTAVLFHAGVLEPKNLRSSYFKFLQAISGERLSNFNLAPFDVYGNNSHQNAREVIKNLNIVTKSNLPKFAMTS
ncbi:transmembrane protein 135-like [Teleopsis dalmanni]|uniref:transmembrane protein 135-like n=1 Tax=Teleopsis dalmanni TaxID=139649 RepID=UPI000D32B855|nr:transmembrane protein 135-like [Teleopsis dalmanni]XP_037943252.1 transmembrane protein 135-like [Teleopsis dalmanni]XP_037943253.1 transmembrane protein 135-like [Teleopsis dalmanni]